MASDGTAELRAAREAVERLDVNLIRDLSAVARRTAERIKSGYQQRLLAQTKAYKTAASARVLDESDRKQFVVNVPGDPGDPEKLGVWLEHGTRHMVAKPAIRPAADAENDRYKADMTDAVQRSLSDTLKVLL